MTIILLNKPGFCDIFNLLKILLKTVSVILLVVGAFIALKSMLLNFMKTGFLPSIFFVPPRFPHIGLYSHSRHPFFMGYSLLLLGIAAFLGDAFIVFVVFILIILLFLLLYLVKERKYKEQFSENYNQYITNVPFFYKIEGTKGPSILKLIAYPIFFILSKILFKVESEGTENIPEEEGALFISNHLSYLDPIFMSAFCHHDLKFFTTADIYNNKLFAFILHKMDTIPVKKYKKDPGAVRKMFRTLRRGESVGYFPEGKRTWTGEPENFPEGISRVLKLVRQPIIPISLCGLDSFMPRWSDSWRRTKVKVVYHEPFEVSKDDGNKEIRERLYKTLHTPNLEFKHQIYTSRNLNQGIERLLWRCPDCGEIDKISEKNQAGVICEECGSEWLLTDDHKMRQIQPEQKNDLAMSLPDWYKKVTRFPLPEVPDQGFYELKSGLCLLKKKRDGTFQKLDKGNFTFNKNEIVFFGNQDNHAFRFSNINSISDPGNKTIQITMADNQYRIHFLEGSSLKWMTIFNEVQLHK